MLSRLFSAMCMLCGKYLSALVGSYGKKYFNFSTSLIMNECVRDYEIVKLKSVEMNLDANISNTHILLRMSYCFSVLWFSKYHWKFQRARKFMFEQRIKAPTWSFINLERLFRKFMNLIGFYCVSFINLIQSFNPLLTI